ncbi:MAG: urease accessory protein UreE, partial [Hyphomicrobiales bacterium]
MHRAVAHLPAGHGLGEAIDSITLAHDERRLRRKLLTGKNGTEVTVDFPNTVTLDHQGALQLEDGRIIEILAAKEVLYAVTARDAAHLL